MGAGGAKMGLSPEEIAKVKEEWEERQRKKQEAAKQKEKDKDTDKGKGKDVEKKDDGKESTKDTNSTSKVPGSLPSSGKSTPSTPSTPSHQRYSLHRDIFALRLAEHRKRRQIAQVKELAPRLPGAPRGSLPSV